MDRFDARSHVKPGITLDEVEEMKETFDLFDVESNGRVSARDLKASLQTLGLASAAIQHVTKDIDRLNLDYLRFEDFMDVMSSELVCKDRMSEIHKVFQLFDVEGQGFIDVQRLQAVAAELGERLSREQLADMIARADSDSDGRVSLDDFYSVMTRKGFP